jgi:5'(3')-deoxyribonucleotidase
MELKIILFIFLVFTGTNLIAQDSLNMKVSINADSVKRVIKANNGKIIKIGNPVSFRPLSTFDKIKMFFEAAYAKYPVWCWFAGIFLLFSVLRLIKRILS